MIIGDRIRERLPLVGISQAELARRVKLDQSTINGLVNGEQRSSTKLAQIARELKTTPAFLEGETDDPEGELPEQPEIDSQTRDLIECFVTLSPTDRAAVLRHAHSLGGKLPPPGKLNAPRMAYRGKGE